MDFFKNLKPSDICIELQKVDIEEDMGKNKEYCTEWINNVLQKCSSNYHVEELYNDLKSGIILSDVIYAFTGVKLKLSPESFLNNKPVMIINLLMVIKAMENDGLFLVNSNPIDIYDGKPKIILGLVWQMMLHFDIRNENVQQYHSLSRFSTNYSLLFLLKNKFIEFPQQKKKLINAIIGSIKCLTKIEMTVKSVIESGKCNEIILYWLGEKLYKSYGIKINNFSSDWQSGIAFMALIHMFRPELINMELIKTNSPKFNILLAIKYASKYLGIKNRLKVEDILSETPNDGAIAFYICQFIRIDLKKNRIKSQSVRKLLIENNDTTRQLFPQEFQLLTIDEENNGNVLTDKYNRNFYKPVGNNIHEYHKEYIRDLGENYSLSLLADSCFFETVSSLENLESKKNCGSFTDNNNLVELDDNNSMNIVSYICDNIIFQENEESTNIFYEKSIMYNIEHLSSSTKLEPKHHVESKLSTKDKKILNNSMKDNGIFSEVPEQSVFNYSDVNSYGSIVYETDPEEFEEKCLDYYAEIQNSSGHLDESEKKQFSNFLDSIIVDSCKNILTEEIINLCLMPLFMLPFNKVYEMMNGGETNDNISSDINIIHSHEQESLMASNKLEISEDQQNKINSMIRNIVLDVTKITDDLSYHSNLENKIPEGQLLRKMIERKIKKLFYTVVNPIFQ
ncbi:Spectrin beta chain, erythrocytic [Strongyloides ratti]|uniref:Spectrin beta chain, erythrocytic n=1 Tax=Strongyloides ratti TaxID=34506 RepID=A0A090LH05_STRRB|nr:Spectrin beta chain, erythrocytic [Strongyloides ratti]CEF66745.1 Spectrin beta chain, erythrocytic [Strongyloides ratti]